MLRHKNIIIISEVKDFFTSSEKAINIIIGFMDSLMLSEKRLGIESNSNNEFKNVTKLLLLLLFPLFDIKDAWDYQNSPLYKVYNLGKDMFYRFMNNSWTDWRKISYKVTLQLIRKVAARSYESLQQTRCLIIDDSDLEKTGRKIELMGKIFSHVAQKSLLGFKGLFMGYHDGMSFFALDFSLHGEKGKNKKKPYGRNQKQ